MGSRRTIETVTLFVAENGDLRAIVTTGAPGVPTTNPPGFGSGAILVTGDQLTGAYDLKRLGSFGVPPEPNESCVLTGTVNERISLSLSLECTDAAGTARSASVTLGYDSDYERDSSLALIAGTTRCLSVRSRTCSASTRMARSSACTTTVSSAR